MDRADWALVLAAAGFALQTAMAVRTILRDRRDDRRDGDDQDKPGGRHRR